MLTRMWGNCNPRTSLVGVWNGAATVENGAAAPQKIKHGMTV